MTKSDILIYAVSIILGVIFGKLIIWAFSPVVSVLIAIGLIGYVVYTYVKAPE